jgi:hypothetical protein
MPFVDDLVALAMALAIAAVVIVCTLIALYLWALKHNRIDEDEPHHEPEDNRTSLDREAK